MKTVIVGGSAGGASVAARLRRLDESQAIVLLEKSATVSFATCGIPYYVGDVIAERERLNVVDPDEFRNTLNVDLRTHCEVIAIDRKQRRVLVRDWRKNRVHTEGYDNLVLATGGKTVLPTVPGRNLPHVFTLNDATDTDSIKRYLEDQQCERAVIVGAGFLGIEAADNLHRLGLNVNLIDSAQQVLGTWDVEMANAAQRHLHDKGLQLHLCDHVTAILPDRVRLASGKELRADLVILALGIKPRVELPRHCGLALGTHGGIQVDDHMLTSDPHIYALGDAVEVQSRITDERLLVPLAGIAHKQSRVVADNICGRNSSFRPAKMTAIVKALGQTLAVTGSTEKNLTASGIAYQKCYVELPCRAGFYPGAVPLTIKLLFAPDSGRILGGQIVGAKGVDKRIDVLATAIHHDATVRDLVDLELAYAPPFSSAKDPINVAAMVATNLLKGDYRELHWDDLSAPMFRDVHLIDVRTPEEYSTRTLEGAVNIPLDELRARMDEIRRDRKIVVFCKFGKKGYFAARLLKQNGFDHVYNLGGGLRVYEMATMDFTQLRPPAHPQPDTGGPIQQNPFHTEIPGETREDSEHQINMEIDACGLACPGPILRLSKAMKTAEKGQIIRVIATDTGFADDVETWCQRNGHKLLAIDKASSPITTILQKV